MNYKEAVEYMNKHNCFPEGFNQWELQDKSGWSMIAHTAALNGYLPKNFNQWHLKNKEGRTVAHMAIFSGCFPKNFNQWYLKDDNGETVFEAMFHYRAISYWFKDWDMVINDDGETCKEVYDRMRYEKIKRTKISTEEFDEDDGGWVDESLKWMDVEDDDENEEDDDDYDDGLQL